MPDKYFKKRAGTTDRGKDYEDLFISYIILHLILDNEIKDFQISSNDENFGAFDDIVMEIEWANRERLEDRYALQLKHSNRPLTLKNLIGKSGDFSVKKYHENFTKLKQELYKWVLLTNRKFNYNEREAVVRLEGDDFDIKIVKYEAEESFLMFCRRNFYQFRSIVEEGVADVYGDFFQRFFLCTEQLDVLKIEAEARSKFVTMFLCRKKVFDDYYKFITEWSLREGKKVKLNKSLARSLIAINLLSPFLKAVPPTVTPDEGTKSRLFREAVSKFQVTYIEEDSFETLRKVLGETVRAFKQNNQVLKEVSIIGTKYQVLTNPLKEMAHLGDEETNKIIFLLNRGPLVVTEDQSIYKALELCEDKNCIILFHPKKELPQNSSFLHLVDLKQHPEVYANILQTFTCDFQGKKTINLEELHSCVEEVDNILSSTHLLQMIQTPLVIGGRKEEIPEPYIQRSVSRFIVDYKFISSAEPDTLIIIITAKDIKLLEKNINVDIKRIEDLMIGGYHQKSVYFCEDCPREMFDSICSRFEGLICHQFKIDSEGLEWVRSSGGVTELKKFLHEEEYMTEDKLTDFEDDMNLICAEAGMGKTTSLRNLKNNYSSNIWTILIYPKDHSKYFRQNGDSIEQFLEYILAKNSSTELDTKLLKMFEVKKRINFLWDGLDETSEESLSVILNIIEKLRKRGYRQWLTSRNNLETLLEQKFSIVARKIRQFDDEEQRNYIRGRLKCSDDHLEEIFDKISRNIQLFRYNKILAIPLQIYMFTHLLITNMSKYKDLLDKIFSLTDLYQCFVDEKFSVLHQEKENFDGWNDMVYKRNLTFKKERIKQYEKVALKVHFAPKFNDITCDTFLEEMKTEADSVGIITHVTEDNVAQFWHTSYSEYFAASYLSKHLELVPQLLNYLVATKYTNIRFFFDLMVAKESPAHVAVLYKNFAFLQICKEEEIRSRDAIGRNLLQLACSWGEQFPDLHPERLTWFFFTAKYRVFGVYADMVNKENEEYLQIVEFLAQRIDPKDVDDLFGFDSFFWADRTYCLTPLEVLASKYRPPFEVFENFGQISSVVFYCAVFDLPNLLEAIKDVPIVEDEFGESVICAAVKNGALNCLKKLLTNKYYKNVMQSCKDKLLDLACSKEHSQVAKYLIECHPFDVKFLNTLLLKYVKNDLEIVKILVDSGAQVTLTNEDGYTLLQLACIFGLLQTAHFLSSRGAKVSEDGLRRCCGEDPQITLFLIQNGAKVTISNEDGTTPIHHASKSGFFETVKVLADHGADLNGGDPSMYMCRPIHFACMKGRLDVVKKLVKLGADVNVKNDLGFTPMDYACGQKFYEVVRFLVKEGVALPEGVKLDFL